MVITGEQSGNLVEMLLKAGEMFEAKTETTTKNLSVILEPILLVIVWLGVVGVALAVIMPIYNLIGGFGV
jgi:type II secretory pathway component PulF